MKPVLTGLCLLLLVGACTSNTRNPSEAHYSRPEATQRAQVERCRVLEVRPVSLGAQPLTTQHGRYGSVFTSDRSANFEETAGATLGAVLGGIAGSQIGGGKGKDIATALGATLGAAAGREQGARMAETRMTRPGLEYSVLLASGREEVIVQYYNEGDRVAPAGSTCRIATSSQGRRVLPGEHLPATVTPPKTTTFR